MDSTVNSMFTDVYNVWIPHLQVYSVELPSALKAAKVLATDLAAYTYVAIEDSNIRAWFGLNIFLVK